MGWEVRPLAIIVNIKLAKSMVIVFVNLMGGPFIEDENQDTSVLVSSWMKLGENATIKVQFQETSSPKLETGGDKGFTYDRTGAAVIVTTSPVATPA
jgi:hypothetical protein